MASESAGGALSSLVDISFSLDDGLKGGIPRLTKFPGIGHGQNLIIDEEGPSLPINPSSISRLNIERGEYPAVVLSFKYLSGVVNDHFNWVNHELGNSEAQQVLNKAKILPTVLLSGLFNVNKDQALLRHLVRRWSKETHTFVCSWGEFTPTLEDVASIMGLPIVGKIDPSNIQLSMEDVDKLCILKEAKDRFAVWVKHFWGFKDDGDTRILKKGLGYDSGCRMEALLSLWLSKFVFSDGKDVIQERVFPLALLLSKGEVCPLAPMFLGHLYQSLDLITTQEKEGIGSKVIDSCVSTAFLQMFMWERLKNPPLKPTSLTTFIKKELIDFKPENLPLMYRWFKRTASMDTSSFLQCLDDEERFKFRPYVDLVNEIPLKLLCDGCEDPAGIDVQPVKKCEGDASLDAYLVTRRGLLPTFSEGIKSTLGEKTKISLVSYFPHRVRRQFGLDQGIPCDQEQNEDGCIFSDLFYGKLETIDESLSITLAGKERIGYKSEAFHNYWLEVLHGFNNYVRPGSLDSRTLPSKSSDGVELLATDGLGLGGRSDGRRELMMKEKYCGNETSSVPSKKRKIRPKVVEETPTKKRAENCEQGKTRMSAIGSSKSVTPDKRKLRPREPQKVISSSSDEYEDDDEGHESSPKKKDHVQMSLDDSANSFLESQHNQLVEDHYVQTPVREEKEDKTDEPGTSLSRSVVTPSEKGKDRFSDEQRMLVWQDLQATKGSQLGTIGPSSLGIPKTPLFVSPEFSQGGPQFPANKIEEVPPSIKDFVYWNVSFEGSTRKLDSIEKLHPSTYSDEHQISFRGMYVCPEVVALLTVFFEKYGDMSQLDCFKYCMCDTKSMIFERLGLLLYSMDKALISNLELNDILEWRDVVRDLLCLNVPIGFLIGHLRKLLRVCYFLNFSLKEETIHQMRKVRLLHSSAEDIYKKVRVEQKKLRDILSHDSDFPSEYSEFIVESSSGIGRTALLGLLDCRP